MGQRHLRWGTVGLVCAALGIAGHAAADAPKKPVVLGEVSTRAAAPSLPDADKLFRQAVESELEALDWTRARAKGRKVTLSASLVRLEAVKTDGHGVQASCTVSATLRDEGGALVAILEGRARADDDVRATHRAERDALAVAVKGAVARVPEALERVR